MASLTAPQRQMLRTIRAGGDIQSLNCPTIRRLLALGYIVAEPTAYGFGRCSVVRA